MNNLKHILLISYIFPPAAGIGGRRWAKFAKYLSRAGYVVHVITAKSNSILISEWLKDIDEPNIRIHLLPTKFPTVLNNTPNSFLDKLEYRFWMYFFKIISRGTLFDRSVFWKSQLLKKASSLIEEFNIKNIIVTIPPFKLAHHSISIKNAFPSINLIVDYRDPWTDNRSFHGFKDLSNKRLEYEVSLENEVLKIADIVITVSEDMTQKLVNRNVISQSKFLTISNGFDEEDVLSKSNSVKQTSNYFTFIYAGTLYSNLDYVIEPLLEFLLELKQMSPTLYHKLRFKFYGTQNVDVSNKIKNAGLEIIEILGQVSLNEVYQKIQNADFCLLFSAPDHSFAFNTKFFEYIACRKPIILFSNLGKTSDFITTNNLGYTIDPSNFKNSLRIVLNKIDSDFLSYNSNFDITQFSVKKLTKEIETVLV